MTENKWLPEALLVDTSLVLNRAFDSEVLRVGVSVFETPIFNQLASERFASWVRGEW